MHQPTGLNQKENGKVMSFGVTLRYQVAGHVTVTFQNVKALKIKILIDHLILMDGISC